MTSIETATGDDRRAALELMLQDFDVAARDRQIDETLAAGARGEVSLDGLLFARDGRRPLGAVLYSPQADGCAFVWPPAVAAAVPDDAAEAIADALLQNVASRLDRSGVWLGQCLLDPADALNAARLQRNGFDVLAELDYLKRSLREPLPEPTTPTLAVDRADPIADAARLAAIIEQTYVESADCPAVSGWRTGMDAVRGHRHTGVLLPEGWLIFRDTSGGDAGVLILADQPEQNAWELVYMGVAPAARGRGYGREIVIAALREAARSQREAVVLAVDARNDYARTVYERLGFRFLESRRVHARRGLPPSTRSERRGASDSARNP